MEFSEKLNFLFELTRAEGKELAAAMNITPPGVSKMRNGSRGLPRNREAAYTIALFFAQRCSGSEQREALSKGMHAAQVLGAGDDEVLADMLLSWLRNEKLRDTPDEKDTEAFLHRLNFSGGTRISARVDATQPLRSAGNNIIAYYGIDGRRAAYLIFLRYVLEKKKAYDICVLSDEDNTWIDDDAFYAKSYYEQLFKLTEQGCFFRRIVGPINNITQAFYSLNRWFPLYMTGKATSFYCKHLRDDINRITVFVVSGVAALYSFSVGTKLDNDCVAFFTTDTQTVSSMASLFKKYLAQCEPATKTFSVDTSEEQMHTRLVEYESCESTCMQLSPSLSFITLPWEIAVSFRANRDTKSKDVFFASFAKRYKVFLKNLEQCDFYDIIQLSNADDVLKGIVAVPAASILGNDTQYYSPDGYIQHLKSIEYLLKRHERYHVVIESTDVKDEPIIYIKENDIVLISRANTPFIMFDICERNLINAFTEKLRRRIPEDVHEESYRKRVLNAIKTLIEQIEAGKES